MNKLVSLAIIILGLVAIVLGAIFVYQGFSKDNLIKDRMRIEKVSLALDPEHPDEITPVQSITEAQEAADIIAAHRRAMAPTYQDLLSGGRFDPTNPQHLTYAQAMNLENYLYLAVTAFGLVQVVMAAGAFMLVTGFAFIIIGLAMYRMAVRASP